MLLRKTVLPLVACLMLGAPTAASAAFLHVVTPGESLSSVAATDGLSVAQLAAANGMSTNVSLVAGSTLAIPPRTSSVAAAPVTGSTAAGSGDGDSDSDELGPSASTPANVASTSSASVASAGPYVVQPGDTLSALAARAGVTVAELAAENGLNPNANLISGRALRLGGAGVAQTEGSATAATATATGGAAAVTQPVGGAAEGSATGPPYPTPERVSASEIASIAAADGVPPSLADAIGWQESGFNNDLVSSAGARGVMQILPGTWNWITSSLATTPLSPDSAADNVRGGVLMLHSLLNATGSPSMTAAGYYQGLPSVRRNGLFPDTQRYVSDVMSLTSSFGGG